MSEHLASDQSEMTKPAVDVVDLVTGPDIRRLEVGPSAQDRVRLLALPRGYGLVGGAARDVAIEVLTGDRLPPRDIDVVAFSELNPDISDDCLDSISRRLMPDDYAFGHGVQVERLADYFQTRDFTLNEVAVIDGELLASAAAVDDLKDRVIRPTAFVHDPDSGRELDYKLAIKAVVLECVMKRELGGAQIKGFDLGDYAYHELNSEIRPEQPFFVALGYQKALEQGEDVAHDFLDRLMQYGIIEPDNLVQHDRRLVDVAKQLESWTFDFEFRGEAARILNELQFPSLGDLLTSLDPDGMDRYEELAGGYKGPGQKFTDESKY